MKRPLAAESPPPGSPSGAGTGPEQRRRDERSSSQLPWPRLLSWAKLQYPLAILAALGVLGIALSEAFWTSQNLTDLIEQSAVIGIVSLAELIVVITGGIDISVGSIVGLSAVLSAGVFHGSSLVLAILVGVGVGAALGAVNGTLIAYRGLEPFIVTLGMLSLARGLVYAYTRGVPVTPRAGNFGAPGSNAIGGFPVLGIIWIATAVLMAYLLYRTVFGRRLYAIGSNSRAAYSSGVPVRRTLLIVYLLAGLLAGLSGFLLSSYLGSGTPTAGTSYELDAIAAVVIGGARLSGGYGRVFGVVVGSLIFGVINNLLVLLNVSTYYQEVVSGGLILVAVTLAASRRSLN